MGGAKLPPHGPRVAAADRSGKCGVVAREQCPIEFGSGVFVPDESGFVLNDRGEGFTEAPNRMPVQAPCPYDMLLRRCASIATDG